MSITKIVLGAVLICGIASGCSRVGNSALNPFNWFSRSAPAPLATGSDGAIIDPRPLMDQIIALEAQQTPGGAIVRATGLAPRQGYFDAVLLPRSAPAPGVLLLEFRANPPLDATRVSTPRSREVTVAAYLTRRQLAGINEIRVTGARNARAVRR